MRGRKLQCSISGLLVLTGIMMILFIILYGFPFMIRESLFVSDYITPIISQIDLETSSYHSLFNISTNIRAPLTSSKNVETMIECIGSLNNQSCLYRNLYFVDQTFTILIVKGRKLPMYSVRTNGFDYDSITPNKREFDSYTDLEQFVRNTIDPGTFSHVTLYFGQYWHENIGHALFDGLYPAYLALIRFAPRHLQPFRILAQLEPCHDCWSEGVYGRFAGLGLLKKTDLDKMSHGKWFVFDELIMGSGTLCQRCLQPNFQLRGGIELNGSQLFRDRMYQQHGLALPVHRHHTQGPLNVYVFDNKRFTIDDKKEIQMGLHELNEETHQRLSQQKEKNQTSMKSFPLIRAYYIHYNGILGQISKTATRDAEDFTPLRDNNFAAQLRKLRKVHIQISGPGTGQMYQTFLADGAVHINLGGIRPNQHEYFEGAYTSFLEQYMTSGTPYIKGLYYPINKRAKGIKKDEMIKLIRQAATMIDKGFSIPVNPRDNLAPDGQIFVDLCHMDDKFCSMVTIRSPATHQFCLDLWIEDLVHEYGQWSIEGLADGDQKIVCPYNRSLLRDLRTRYGISHQSVREKKI